MADAVRLGKPFFVQISHHAPRKPIETRQATLTEWSNTALPFMGVKSPMVALCSPWMPITGTLAPMGCIIIMGRRLIPIPLGKWSEK